MRQSSKSERSEAAKTTDENLPEFDARPGRVDVQLEDEQHDRNDDHG
jgi:hypothetical protein